MVLTPGFEPGSHWWEESALHHAPLLPTSLCQTVDILRVVIFSKVPITFRAPNQIFKPNSKKIKVKPVYNGLLLQSDRNTQGDRYVQGCYIQV